MPYGELVLMQNSNEIAHTLQSVCKKTDETTNDQVITVDKLIDDYEEALQQDPTCQFLVEINFT